MARILLNGITKNYGNTPVLNSTHLDIADGEFLTLVGPSGCGKSTTLRIIAGLETQTDGDIEINGKIVNSVRPSRRDLAMVFQSYALYPHLTVGQNLATPLKLRDLSFWERMPLFGPLFPGYKTKAKILNNTVLETAAILRIEHLLNRRPGQLSGGQRQRVALGRAMVRKPAAFLMDEPLSNLDAALRVHMRSELAELHRTLGTTFVYVTHDQAEALTMSDRIAVMMEGDILQVGKPSDVYKEPANIRVAEFVGSPKINILDGECDSFGEITCLGVPIKQRLNNLSSHKIYAGIRPEHLLFSHQIQGDSFVGKLTYKENLGSDLFLHVQLNNSTNRLVARANPSEVENIPLGSTINLKFNHEKVQIFGEDGNHLKTIKNTSLETKNR